MNGKGYINRTYQKLQTGFPKYRAYFSYRQSFLGYNITVVAIVLALCLPVFCGEIHDAAERGDLATVKALLKENPALVSSKDNEGRTPLYWAAIYMDVEKLLLEKGADINAKDNYGFTPLHWAAAMGNKDVVELLLSKKARVNARDNRGDTPLHYAANRGLKDIADLLLAKGAGVNAMNKQGETPLHRAVSGSLFRRRTPEDNMHIAELLIAHKANVNARDINGETPLHRAMNKQMSEFLRQHGGHE